LNWLIIGTNLPATFCLGFSGRSSFSMFIGTIMVQKLGICMHVWQHVELKIDTFMLMATLGQLYSRWLHDKIDDKKESRLRVRSLLFSRSSRQTNLVFVSLFDHGFRKRCHRIVRYSSCMHSHDHKGCSKSMAPSEVMLVQFSILLRI
jgi:hypothetical protein